MTNPQGRPPLSPRDATMRMGFCGLKKHWAALTAWGALTGKTFSEVMREAIDEYMTKRGL